MNKKELLALKKLGKRLRQLRKEKGFSSADSASHAWGISRAQLGKYESGKYNINYLTLVRILEAMDISPTEFFSEGFEDEK